MFTSLRNKLDSKLAHPLLDAYWHAVLAAMVWGIIIFLTLIGVILVRLYLELRPFPVMPDWIVLSVFSGLSLSHIIIGVGFGYWRYRWLKQNHKLKTYDQTTYPIEDS
ncbi:MAG TPA: hypothetical protein DCM28_12500 [Phycisphaerales bacterium]|nr:hypothetical protein [Phycisphaerales bacterium]HCD33129.1 hypothetical protein [Phycisphaerales bacterium]|tara:strand:- start:565 stop:888 length:324 start_codon:yes stop_codon:yes gene_type:complete